MIHAILIKPVNYPNHDPSFKNWAVTVFLERGEQKSKRMAELESKVDRCLRRCDSDLERFGNEIELEQPGIREKLDEDAMNLEPRDKNHSEATDEDDYQVCIIYM